MSRPPQSFPAGVTVSWTVELSDYPASDGHTLRYIFTTSAARFEAIGVASGDAYDVTIGAATSIAYAPGAYTWIAFVELAGGDRYEVGRGTTIVEPSVLGGPIDARTDARRNLDAIQAVIAGRATRDQIAMSINGRSLQRCPLEELLRLESRFLVLVAAEEGRSPIARRKVVFQ